MALHSWLTSSLVRHFPLARAEPARPLALEGALSEQFSFQVTMRTPSVGSALVVGVQVGAHVAVGARGTGVRVG